MDHATQHVGPPHRMHSELPRGYGRALRIAVCAYWPMGARLSSVRNDELRCAIFIHTRDEERKAPEPHFRQRLFRSIRGPASSRGWVCDSRDIGSHGTPPGLSPSRPQPNPRNILWRCWTQAMGLRKDELGLGRDGGIHTGQHMLVPSRHDRPLR